MTTKTTKTPKPAPERQGDPDTDAAEAVNVPAIYKRLTQGDKLRLSNALGVSFTAVGLGSPEYMVAVVWKHRQATTGQVKIADLLDMTDGEIVAALGLTADQLGEQFNTYAESLEAGEDDSKSV